MFEEKEEAIFVYKPCGQIKHPGVKCTTSFFENIELKYPNYGFIGYANECITIRCIYNIDYNRKSIHFKILFGRFSRFLKY